MEFIASGGSEPNAAFLPAIELRELVSGACGARGLSTGTAGFRPGAELAYHSHLYSEATTILEGEAEVSVEGRCYRLSAFDSIHFPAGVGHRVVNSSSTQRLLAHWAFPSAQPAREAARTDFPEVDLRDSDPQPGSPETIVRFAKCEIYELSDRAYFTDLFARRLGSVGICGGYGRFEPGASLPCHIHRCDESITIVSGRAVCEVMGRRYELSGCDTAFVPEGRAHRFLNLSEQTMAMIWVYASDEPERTLLDSRYCTGELAWPAEEKK
jgi:putative monooxygenase